MIRKKLITLIPVSGLLLAGYASGALETGPGKVPFWIAGKHQQIDAQVAALLARDAAVITLRLPGDREQQAQRGAAVVKLLKRAAPRTPVLLYSWASRNKRNKPGSDGIMDWVDSDPERMQIRAGRGWARPRLGGRAGRLAAGDDQFGDVTRPEFQTRTASSIDAAVERGGFDGVALDLAIRTPRYKPGPLAKLCAKDSSFCARYAEGMDKTFAAVRAALGSRPILYNGLWNFGPGMVEDQSKLLQQADAAQIEYFGRRPSAEPHSFSQDILPYLQAMAQIPADKKIFAHGRGSWQYTDYAEDYAWQRYVFCAYLLAARPNVLFRYDASSQLDMRQGRSTALAVYADWLANLGEPAGAYRSSSGLYSRAFSNGLVLVAPDDGDGGSYELPHPFYSPEGKKYEGRVSLRPAEGLLLLDKPQAIPTRDDLLDLKLLSDWPGSSLKEGILSLQAGSPAGSHDMLLDAVRAMHPRTVLKLQVRPHDQAHLQAVAEVDDDGRQHQFAVVEIGARGRAVDRTVTPVVLRSPVAKKGQGQWPAVAGTAQLEPGQWQDLTLDGQALFAKTDLTFRRWSHIRFGGAVDLKSVQLSD